MLPESYGAMRSTPYLSSGRDDMEHRVSELQERVLALERVAAVQRLQTLESKVERLVAEMQFMEARIGVLERQLACDLEKTEKIVL